MIAPAMNVRMRSIATQANIHTLESRNVMVIPPETGPMACGEVGPGDCPILRQSSRILNSGGRKIWQLYKVGQLTKTAIVTAGLPTTY